MHQSSPIFAIALGALCAVGCPVSYPPKPPPPAVSAAPVELRPWSIHVHRLVQPPETPQDEWDYHHMPGYTSDLRDAFALQLTRAGYKVVVDRRSPYDLLAVVQASWPMDKPGVATVTISRGDREIEQLSVEVPVFLERRYDIHLEEHAAVALVESMNRSGALLALAHAGPPPPHRIDPPHGDVQVAASASAGSPPGPVMVERPEGGAGGAGNPEGAAGRAPSQSR